MATLETLLSQQMIERLGWTLIHFVWQAAVVTLLLAVVLRCLRRSSSNVRYIASCLALALIVALPLVTMSFVEVSRPVAEAGPILTPPPADPTPVEVIELADLPLEPLDAAPLETPQQTVRIPWTQRIATALEPALPWLVLGWLLGVFGLSTWHLGGWAQLQRMKRRMVRNVAEPLHAALAKLSSRLGVRRTVGLLESALVDVPTVVGWLKPVILLPASALSGLTTEQFEAILAHELAHVRRCDYLVNLAQTVVEILGFYHPAIWWISHRIRDERENCCDDLAVQVCGDSRRYARALTCLEELRHHSTELAVAASGGSLVGRIARLLGRPPVDHRRFAWLPGLIALLVVAALLIPAALLIAAPNPPTLPRPEANSTGQMGSRDVERTRFVHRNIDGRVDREFGFEQLIREEGGRWIVAHPRLDVFIGETRWHITADLAELQFNPMIQQVAPDNVRFLDHVVIRTASINPDANSVCTLYLDEGTFSGGQTRFTSSGPFRLLSDGDELLGLGLELSCGELQGTPEPNQLRIVEGVGVHITTSGFLISHVMCQTDILQATLYPALENRVWWITPEPLGDARREHVNADPVVRELAKRIAEIEVELLEAQQMFLPEHPEIAQKKQLLEAMNTLLEKRHRWLEQEFRADRTYVTTPDDQERQRANAETVLAILRQQLANVDEEIDKAGGSAWYPDEAERSRKLGALRQYKEMVKRQAQEITRRIEEQFGPPAEPEPYQLSETDHSSERMKHLGLALRLYAESHDGRYPDDILALDPYLSVEDSRWTETSVVYLGKGKTANDESETPIAYDRSLLEKTGNAPGVFADGQIRSIPVEALTPAHLKTNTVEMEARFVLVDRECMEAIQRGLPIEGVTAPADVNALHALGNDWAGARTPVLEPNQVELLLRAVRQYTASKMLAAPKVIVRDGESASISLANHIHYISGYREPNDPLQEPIPQHASKEIGMRLDTTSHLIEGQNNIRLRFEMEINSLLGMQKALYRGKYEYDVPTFTTVTVDTEIVIPDGQTALIHAGPMRSLGDILSNESDPPAPMLMLIKPTRTPVRPPDPTAPMPDNRRPGDPGMGGLPPGIGLP